MRTAFHFLGISAFLVLTTSFAGALVVTSNSDSGPGSLREAVSLASSGSSITFEPSLDGQTITLAGSPIQLNESLSIDASGLTNGITIDAASLSKIFYIPYGKTITLNSLNITNGRSLDGRGGAIYIYYSTLIINNSSISASSATVQGGGIFNNNGNLTLNDSTVSGNYAGSGGGGITNDGVLTLNNSTLSGNRAGFEGGSIYNNTNRILNLNSCTISGNSADRIGGIINRGFLSISNSTISGNSGRIYSSVNPVSGGIANLSSLTLKNSIISGNTAPLNPDIYGSITDATGNNITSGNPLLAPLGDYGGRTQTMPPLPGSPAIEAGIDDGTLPLFDQRSADRIIGANPDIGAVEAFPLVSLNLDSTDGDTIPDIFEGRGRPYPHLDPETDDSDVDTDGDGSPDADEIASMTNLYDANDYFRILNFVKDLSFDPDNPVFILTLKTFPGMKYAVHSGVNLRNLTKIPGSDVTAIADSTIFQVELPPGRGFIRATRNP